MMKKNISSRWLACIAIALSLTVTFGYAMAYFTDHEAAKGDAVLDLSGKTELHETMDGNDKLITIENTGETDMVVRAAVFGDENYLKVIPDENGEWVQGKTDGFWYYTKVLQPGDTTPVLKAEVKAKAEGEELPDIDFDIVVVHEASRTAYEDGKVAAPEGWKDFPEIQAPDDLKAKAA